MPIADGHLRGTEKLIRYSVFLNARTKRREDDRKLMKDLETLVLRARNLGFSAMFMPDHRFNG
jgi:hypothetical protein